MIKTFLFLPLAVCFLCLSGKGPLLAAEVRQKIAVMDFEAVNTTADLGEGTAEILRTMLMGTGKYIVVERSMLKEVLKEQKPGLTGAVDQPTAVGIGKVLGVQLVAVGSLVKIGVTYTLNVRFVAVETGEVVLGKNLTASNEQELSGLCGDMVKVLTGEETSPQPIINPIEVQTPKIKSIRAPGHWALGGLYPGASLKYVTGGKTAWELRAQAGSGAFALGPRYYRYFKQAANPRLFFGIEADYLTFKGKVSKSTGYAGGAFVGGEIFLTKQIGLLMDFGPMYLSLSDKDFSESASNLEYVMNMGIYWHFK